MEHHEKQYIAYAEKIVNRRVSTVDEAAGIIGSYEGCREFPKRRSSLVVGKVTERSLNRAYENMLQNSAAFGD